MDLLIRDIDTSTKELLSQSAARHGRSQQGEAKAILEASLKSQNRSWVRRLHDLSLTEGGVDLLQPERHAARELDTGGWL